MSSLTSVAVLFAVAVVAERRAVVADRGGGDRDLAELAVLLDVGHVAQGLEAALAMRQAGADVRSWVSGSRRRWSPSCSWSRWWRWR